MEGKGATVKLKARQLELAWEERIGWEELPAQIRLQLREELARVLTRVAVAAEAEVDNDDGEC